MIRKSPLSSLYRENQLSIWDESLNGLDIRKRKVIEFLLFIVQITLQIINLINAYHFACVNNIQWLFLNVKRLSIKIAITFIVAGLGLNENENENLLLCDLMEHCRNWSRMSNAVIKNGR